jgi:osmotically-inducible protein OsmY
MAISFSACPDIDSMVDENLAKRIRLLFGALNLASLRRIRVEVENGSVLIEGAVRTFYERQLVLSCVQRVDGVRQVADLIVVDGDAGSTYRNH